LKIRKEVAAKGGQMFLRNINPDVMQVFKMTKLDGVFEIQ
jgi:anti-anti-sigma regulatory factor